MNKRMKKLRNGEIELGREGRGGLVSVDVGLLRLD